MPAIKERNLTAETAQRLREVLEEVPFVDVLRIEQQVPIAPGRVSDLVVEIQTPVGARRLLVEVKTEGLPRTLRDAGEQLKAYVASVPDAYGVVAAPYISDRGRALCQQFGVGCLDLAGNVLLAFDQVFIEKTGYPNPSPVRRLRRALFSPRSTRVLRVLLADPARRWYVRDLAAEARISLAQTSNLKRALLEQDLLGEERRRFWLAKPEDLLRDWAQAYTYEVNDVRSLYSMLRIPEVEERLAAECERRGMRYGLALFSGASRVAPFARYDRAFAFVDERLEDYAVQLIRHKAWQLVGRAGFTKDDREDIEQDLKLDLLRRLSKFNEIAAALELKAVPTGANVILLRPYDEGVFYGLQDVGGAKVVSDIQLYLDLKSYKGRGEEAADFLYERRIRPRWNPEPDQTTQPEQ